MWNVQDVWSGELLNKERDCTVDYVIIIINLFMSIVDTHEDMSYYILQPFEFQHLHQFPNLLYIYIYIVTLTYTIIFYSDTHIYIYN